ncbi:hypothetical protein GCM10009551_104590 [Nocardiopsis tropica]|uniref:DUF6790 family protein n=1 Tax=Tsukamurella strandjordii TaxID=147577 RepID=UPI0031D0E61A
MSDAYEFTVQSAAPLFLPLLAVIGASIGSVRHRDRALEIWQRWWLVVAAAGGSVWVGLSFLFAGDVMAEAIGFPAGNPFQFEIAFANVGFAFLAVIAAYRRPELRLALGLGYGIFLWGAAYGHVFQWFAHGDHQPGNTGGILVFDIGVPLLIVILALVARQGQSHPTGYVLRRRVPRGWVA